MSKPEPIYTPESIKVAYQLLWSLSVFWKKAPGFDVWLDDLKAVAETDGVRLLEHRFATPTTSLFLLSTRPEFVPQDIPRVIKGRLQYLVRDEFPKAFQRNFDLRAIGSTSREKTEAYVASQLEHHHADDPELRRNLADLQFENPEVDLGSPQFVAHARYWLNLHLVLVHDWRKHEHDSQVWQTVRDLLRQSAAQRGWEFSRLGVLPDHLHLTLRIRPSDAPQAVVLSCMNNVAFAHDMQPVLMPSCWIGTIGEYDLGAIHRSNES